VNGETGETPETVNQRNEAGRFVATEKPASAGWKW
jgi:hypothetical protein